MAKQPRENHALITLDTNLSKSLHTLFHPHLPSSLLLLLELSADFRFSFPLSAAILLSPISSPSLLPFLCPLLLGLLLDLALVGLIKIIFRRSRPPYNPSMSAAVSADHYSFPSGHASRVSFLATLVFLSAEVIGKAAVELRGGGGRWVEWIGGDIEKVVVSGVCVWAAVTAASRVLLGRHFVFDVLAGVCLGVLEGLFAFRFLRFENHLSMLLYQKATQGKIAVE